MNKEFLFLRTLEDLRDKISSDDHYEILKAAGLIRLLLIDGGSLVDKVNQSFRLKLTFTYVDPRTGAGAAILGLSPDSLVVADGLYPETQICSGEVVTKRADNFLSELAIVFDGQEYSVRDVIKFIANELGGVHHDDPQPGTLHDLEYMLGQLPAAVYGLKAIGRVIIDALKP